MTDPMQTPPDLSSITNSLKIDEAIQRSRKVMEESKALTYKNTQKKSLIDEKLKSVLSLHTENPSASYKNFEKPKSYLDSVETPKNQSEDIHSELRALNSKISSQLTQIRLLEMNVTELKLENSQLLEENRQVKLRHKQEIEYLTEMYEEKLKGEQSRVDIRIEKRMRELEESFGRQVKYNLVLEQKISEIGRASQVNKQNSRILEIEKEYESNQEKISEFEGKLENAKKILKEANLKTGEMKKKVKEKGKEKGKGKSKKKVSNDN